VIAALIAASTALLGNGLIAIKLPSLLLYPATTAVLYALGKRLYSARVGFWAGLGFMSMPLVAALGLFVSTDAPLLLCWSLALLFLLRALERDGWADWLACGAVIGVGLLSKYTMAAFLPSALLLVVLDARHRRWLARPQPWVAVLLALAILSPNLYWNWAHDFPTFRHTAEITRVGHGERGWHPGSWASSSAPSGCPSARWPAPCWPGPWPAASGCGATRPTAPCSSSSCRCCCW
jgi:4-amino-4-deoxy-L-arabinose transferase-like glycosyltransferase